MSSSYLFRLDSSTPQHLGWPHRQNRTSNAQRRRSSSQGSVILVTRAHVHLLSVQRRSTSLERRVTYYVRHRANHVPVGTGPTNNYHVPFVCNNCSSLSLWRCKPTETILLLQLQSSFLIHVVSTQIIITNHPNHTHTSVFGI